ncbi:DNA alkylation repair protein [Alistipes onderdonkii]|uniref:DNA alkylation repair protein n=1 Tax=Alistipes onderdonkii TaxID=328813 RepID=UPI001E6568C4|nr:DNA alkylation repair protein [Alistipes onderdonkii]
MDYTSRMVALLRELRRERNGAVADSMRYYGTPYGLNYGVSLPTLRRIARAEAPDHGFARYLYRQDVRELRLAALHIACPACLTPEEFPAWAAGIVNSEIAEEAAFALLSRAEAFPALFSAWIASPDALLQYAALLAAARSPRLTASWVAPAVEAVHRNATAEATVEMPAEAMTEATAAADTSVAPGAFVADTSVTEASSPEVTTPAPGDSSVGDTHSAAIVSAAPGASPAADPHVASPCAAGQQVSSRPLAQHPVPAARLTAQGAVALLAAVAAQNEENRQAVLRAAGSLGKLPAEDYVHEELAWRLEA